MRTASLQVLILGRPNYAENNVRHGWVGTRRIPDLSTKLGDPGSQLSEGRPSIRTEWPNRIVQVRSISGDGMVGAVRGV
jgi:hypothetical protein